MKSKIIAIALCLFIGSGISYAALTDGLVSGWSFDDGTAKDGFGKNNGKIKGVVKVVEGKFGKAFSFSARQDYVNLGNKNYPTGKSARTVAFWTFLRDRNARDNYFMSWGECLKGGAFFAPRIDNATISLMVNNSAGHLDITTAQNVDAIAEVWSHLVYRYNGKTTVEIFLNGSSIHIGDVSKELNTSKGQDAYIAARNCFGGYNNGIDASIDEIYLWDRALSKDEIASLFKRDKPLSVEPSGKLSTLWGMIKRQTR